MADEALEVFLFGDEVEDDLVESGLLGLQSAGLVLEELLVGLFLGP